MKKIRKGDQVIVIAGKDKGRHGLVLVVNGERVLVEGVNLVKKHVKPNPAKWTAGGIENKSMPLHVSNLALVDENGKASRVGIRIDNGRKARFLKTTGAAVGV